MTAALFFSEKKPALRRLYIFSSGFLEHLGITA